MTQLVTLTRRAYKAVIERTIALSISSHSGCHLSDIFEEYLKTQGLFPVDVYEPRFICAIINEKQASMFILKYS